MPPDIRRRVLQEVAGNGVATRIEYVRTGHLAALRVMDTSEDVSDSAVLLFRLTGDFVANAHPRPAGATAPAGHFMTLIFDSASGELRDFGLSNSKPDLESVGTPIVLA